MVKYFDYLGKELSVGDDVIFPEPRYRNFIRGKVKAFTPMKVRVEYIKDGNNSRIYEYLEYPETFVKV